MVCSGTDCVRTTGGNPDGESSGAILLISVVNGLCVEFRIPSNCSGLQCSAGPWRGEYELHALDLRPMSVLIRGSIDI